MILWGGFKIDFRIEQELREGELQVGDIVVSKDNEICSVIADYKNGEQIYFYIRPIFGTLKICNLSGSTLKQLTEKAIYFNYSFYPQEEFELILKRKEGVEE